MQALIAQAIQTHLPGRSARTIEDRGAWNRRIYKITLDNGQQVVLKLEVRPDFLEATLHETQVVEIFRAHGLPAARVLAVDRTCQILPYPFIIQEAAGGIRLGDALAQAGRAEAEAIYACLGELYARLHAIQGVRSGVWNESPDRPFGEPNEHMYRYNIVEGSGKQALDQGRISPAQYRRAVDLWAQNMDYLKDHRPVLIHGSPFPWTIYLERAGFAWRVVKLASLGDVMWWDAAYELAFFQFPLFLDKSEARWSAVQRAYRGGGRDIPDQKRMLLYAVMQRLMAAMGVFVEPQTPANQAWSAGCLADLDTLMDGID